MLDPAERISASGTIVTGVARERVHLDFESVLAAAVIAVRACGDHASLYLYGSVATGRASRGRSDVDLLTIDVEADVASSTGNELSVRFADRCRAVEIAPTRADDFVGDDDEVYGNRVFLRHYCLLLVGPRHHAMDDFPADARAARGFNGDIAQHAERWRQSLGDEDPSTLARRIARKSLLAVAGLVSIHDHTWTTDRESAATRWATIAPTSANGLTTMIDWAEGDGAPTTTQIRGVLDDDVDPIVTAFAETIGLWS